MNSKDKENYIKRYNKRYKEHGYSSLSLGWGEHGKQNIRFEVLYNIGIKRDSSILDVGCGFGDFYTFLKEKGWHGNYLGIDIVDNLLHEAKKQNNDINVKNIDILNSNFIQKYDYVVCSGIFGAKFKHEDNYIYIERVLSKMYQLSNKGVVADFISTHVDFQAELNFHADPCEIIKITKNITNRVVIRHDYLPFEFASYLHHKSEIDIKTKAFIKQA